MTHSSSDRLAAALSRQGLAPVRLSAGRGGAVVVPELGGRVLSLTLDGIECLWRDPRLEADFLAAGWNAGGQRTWVAPEHAPHSLFRLSGGWACPLEMDPGSFQPRGVSRPDSVGLRTRFTLRPEGRPVAFGLDRRIRLAPAGGGLRLDVTQRLWAPEPWPAGRRYGAWSILQVPAPGLAVVRLRRLPGTASIYRDDFFAPVPAAWHARGAGWAAFYLTGDRQFKAGLRADALPHRSVVEYYHPLPGSRRWLRIVQRVNLPRGGDYADAPGGEPAPGGDVVQFYNHRAPEPFTYAEIEAHGPAGGAGRPSSLTVRFDFHLLSARQLQALHGRSAWWPLLQPWRVPEP